LAEISFDLPKMVVVGDSIIVPISIQSNRNHSQALKLEIIQQVNSVESFNHTDALIDIKALELKQVMMTLNTPLTYQSLDSI
jgi:hypothetical protein